MSDRLRPESESTLVTSAAELLSALRESPPLTHCITNAVVTGFTANVLLALGAAPAMVDIVDEAGLFAGVASGVLINLGTPTPEQRAASLEAVAGAAAAGTPWVLDPVAIGSLPVRTSLAHSLVASRPAAIRGNASEILALAGLTAGGRGRHGLAGGWNCRLPGGRPHCRDRSAYRRRVGEPRVHDRRGARRRTGLGSWQLRGRAPRRAGGR